MEYRRLISFGKSSFVVSLPKAWIGQNDLKKGDFIYLQENGPNLLLSKKETDEKGEEREKIIYVDGKSEFTIEREVYSTYIQNYPRIVLRGKEIKNKVKELQHIVQSLIALEIMEQTSDTIVAKDFLNMDSVSVEELIRKMDLVTRTMMKEAQQIFIEDTYESLNERDNDVNRLYFLLYRSVLYHLKNPMKALKNFKLSGNDLLRIHFIGFYIEAIADEIRRTVRHARNLKLNPPQQAKLQQFLQKMNDYYLSTMKSVYNKDTELAF
ncbi:MAG: phosphate uptake regulator PhoU, partial [Nanoarchaeota archaeon]